MPNETCTTSQHEEAVQASMINHLVNFFIGKCSRAAEHIHKGHSDTSVHIQDQIRFLARCNCFNSKCEIENFGLSEMLQGKIFDEFHSHVRVRLAFDTMSDSHDKNVILFA